MKTQLSTIRNCSRNCMGTISFAGQFSGMRKPQDFIVYPMQDSGTKITIQSDTRIGTIDLFNGLVSMSQPHANGAYFVHLQMDKPVFSMISREDCMTLQGWIKSIGGPCVGGDNALAVYCDNTGALAL